MNGLQPSDKCNAHSLRAGLVAAVLGVTACFGAAVSFAGETVQASEVGLEESGLNTAAR